METEWQRCRELATQAERERNYAVAEGIWAMAVLLSELCTDGKRRLAFCLDRLGHVLTKQRKCAQARHFLNQSWGLRTQLLNSPEPEKAATLNLIAEMNFVEGKPEEAEQICKQVYQIYVNALGLEHPQTKAAASNLAAVSNAVATKRASAVPAPGIGSAASPAPATPAPQAPQASQVGMQLTPTAQAPQFSQVGMPLAPRVPQSSPLPQAPAPASAPAGAPGAGPPPQPQTMRALPSIQPAAQAPQVPNAPQTPANVQANTVPPGMTAAAAQTAALMGLPLRQTTQAPAPQTNPQHVTGAHNPAVPAGSGRVVSPAARAQFASGQMSVPPTKPKASTSFEHCEKCGNVIQGSECLRCTGTSIQAISPYDKLT